jgi:D-lactate dehydrogenase
MQRIDAMKVAIFSSHLFERDFFLTANSEGLHELVFFDASLNAQTASLAKGFDTVCCFVTDKLDSETLGLIKNYGVRLVALRSAGYNNVNLEEADRLGIPVVRVPAYSPHAVAEYAVGILLSLNRKIHRAYVRVRELNFSLDGLMGFDLSGKTVGVIGTGRIGSVFAKIMIGFGCRVIAYDPKPNPQLISDKTVEYVDLKTLYKESDVISLHVPLLPETKHLIDGPAISQMKKGTFVINTGRGALLEAHALIEALKSGHLGGAALDVYEEEDGIFFKDLSDKVLKDDVLARLLTFPNILLTSHQAFFTREAVTKIVQTTLWNISEFEEGKPLVNEVLANTHVRSVTKEDHGEKEKSHS